jgi:hypothetical protein
VKLILNFDQHLHSPGSIAFSGINAHGNRLKVCRPGNAGFRRGYSEKERKRGKVARKRSARRRPMAALGESRECMRMSATCS